MHPVVVIDDTGSPGSNAESKYLKDDRKTHVALLLTASERRYVEEQMATCLELLKKSVGQSEFHFAEIYSGNGKWRNVDENVRISIFIAFCEIFSQHSYPFIVQTCDSNFLHSNGMLIKGDVKIDGLRMTNNSELSLLFLLIRCMSYIESNKSSYGSAVDFIIDEGIYPNGYKQKSELLKDIATNNYIVFCSSSECLLLQLADFGAFCLNRMQLLAIKKKRSDFDNYMLQVISRANLNFINIPRTVLDISELDQDFYDYFQFQQRIIDGSLKRKQALDKFKKHLP